MVKLDKKFKKKTVSCYFLLFSFKSSITNSFILKIEQYFVIVLIKTIFVHYKNTIMKTKITLLITLFISVLVNAQPFYTFTKLTNTYIDLVNPVSINNNKPWQKHNVNNTLYWDYTLPFNFKINGVNYKFITFDGANISLFSMSTSEVEIYGTGIHIADKSAANATTSVSPIGYKIDGSAGNRIFKMQFKNVGSSVERNFYFGNTYYLNLQIWLYEGSNMIEYRIGDHNLSTYNYPNDEPYTNFGFGGEPSSGTFVCMLYDDAQNPLLGEYTNSSQVTLDNYGFVGYPVSGTVFRFTPATKASVHESLFDTVKVYPNPTADFLFFDYLTETKQYTIYNVNGKIVKKGTISEEHNKINVSEIPAAVYLLQIDQSAFKFVKK